MRNSRKKIKEKLAHKYSNTEEVVDKFTINDIIRNRPTHVTSVFKEYLVFDEPIEFLKREYAVNEVKSKMKKLTDFHNTYFKVFPNFILLPEKYYMYKLIERKQRVIDDVQYRMMMKEQREKYPSSKFSDLFNTSYMKHISTFRSRFEKEDKDMSKPDIFKMFDPRKESISSSYSKNSNLLSKLNSMNNSLEMALSKVDTS